MHGNGWVLGFNHHAKEGSKMVVMMDLDQNLSLLEKPWRTPMVYFLVYTWLMYYLV